MGSFLAIMPNHQGRQFPRFSAVNQWRAHGLLKWAGIMIFPFEKSAGAPYGQNVKSGREAGYSTYKVAVAAVIWLAALVTCTAFMNRYAAKPGPAGLPPDHWPLESRIVLNSQHPTLLMFAHPHCPCTRASIRELELVASDCQGKVDAQVWFIKPAGTALDWTNTDLWRSATAIPGVTVHVDENGVETQRFQGETSGQTMLYAPSGQLLFHGGITIARGHEGDNPGVDAIESLLLHKDSVPVAASTPVFGCELFGSCSRQDVLQNTNQNKSGGAVWKH
jgi:hypothetical protein